MVINFIITIGFLWKCLKDILFELRRIPFPGEIAREEVCGTIDPSLHSEKYLAIQREKL